MKSRIAPSFPVPAIFATTSLVDTPRGRSTVTTLGSGLLIVCRCVFPSSKRQVTAVTVRFYANRLLPSTGSTLAYSRTSPTDVSVTGAPKS